MGNLLPIWCELARPALSRSNQPSSCYGNAYVEYDLEHEAFNVPLENYDRGITCFNFGLAAIRSGKALAAERVLTLPLGGSDRESFSGAPFLKTELSGRPISGSYRLRIKESPGLDWSSIEDVQLLLNYRYWSRVQANSAQ
jgi:hypothetical protein